MKAFATKVLMAWLCMVLPAPVMGKKGLVFIFKGLFGALKRGKKAGNAQTRRRYVARRRRSVARRRRTEEKREKEAPENEAPAAAELTQDEAKELVGDEIQGYIHDHLTEIESEMDPQSKEETLKDYTQEEIEEELASSFEQYEKEHVKEIAAILASEKNDEHLGKIAVILTANKINDDEPLKNISTILIANKMEIPENQFNFALQDAADQGATDARVQRFKTIFLAPIMMAGMLVVGVALMACVARGRRRLHDSARRHIDLEPGE